MLVNFRPGERTIMVEEAVYVPGTYRVHNTGYSVLEDMHSKAFGQTAVTALYMPTAYGTEAECSVKINNGEHVEGVLFRLVAFFLEHLMDVYPDNAFIRTGNAAACYWDLDRNEHSRDTLSISDIARLKRWNTLAVSGEREQFPVAIYVREPNRILGMALLTRLCSRGGPVGGIVAMLLNNFDPLSVVLVGRGVLAHDFPNIQRADWGEAIRQAFFILRAFNGVTNERVNSVFYAVVHNLTIVNTALLSEHDMRPHAYLPSEQREGKINMLEPDTEFYEEQLSMSPAWQRMCSVHRDETLISNKSIYLSPYCNPANLSRTYMVSVQWY